MKFFIYVIANPGTKLFLRDIRENAFTLDFTLAYKYDTREKALEKQTELITLGLDAQIDTAVESKTGKGPGD